MTFLGGGAVSYERGTPVDVTREKSGKMAFHFVIAQTFAVVSPGPITSIFVYLSQINTHMVCIYLKTERLEDEYTQNRRDGRILGRGCGVL